MHDLEIKLCEGSRWSGTVIMTQSTSLWWLSKYFTPKWLFEWRIQILIIMVCWITRVHNLKVISIGSSVSAGLVVVTNAKIDRHSDRPISYYSFVRCGRNSYYRHRPERRQELLQKTRRQSTISSSLSRAVPSSVRTSSSAVSKGSLLEGF